MNQKLLLLLALLTFGCAKSTTTNEFPQAMEETPHVASPSANTSMETSPASTGVSKMATMEAYDPCRDAPCPPKPDDPETEEDFKYSLPPKK